MNGQVVPEPVTLEWLKLAVSAITPFIALAGAVILYFFQRRSDRADALKEEKRAAYRDFMHALFDHADERTELTRKAYDKSKVAMMMVAPDAVVEKLVPVQEMATMDMDATGPGDVHATVLDLIVEMRKDCFEHSELDADEFGYVVPIGRPTPLTAEPEGHFEPTTRGGKYGD